MHIEVELALEVVAAELAKVCLVPYDCRRLADFVEPCPTREEGVNYRGYMFLVLLNEFALRNVSKLECFVC